MGSLRNSKEDLEAKEVDLEKNTEMLNAYIDVYDTEAMPSDIAMVSANAENTSPEVTEGETNVVVSANDIVVSENETKTITTNGKCSVNGGFDFSEISDKVPNGKLEKTEIGVRSDLFGKGDKEADAIHSDDCLEASYPLVCLTLRVCVALVCGIVFGFCVQKGRVFEPKSIRDQMVFESFIMLKMFLAAVCTGQIIFSVLSILPQTKQLFQEAIVEYIACFGSKGIVTSALGATILGAGMTLAGACPGMVLAQVGSWVPNSIFTLLGCLIGALSYGMVAPLVEKFTKPKTVFKNQTVTQSLGWPFIAIALPMSVMMFVAVFLLEYFWDYEKDLANIDRALPPYDNIVTSVAWRPSIAGGIIGILQLPLIFTVHDTMGGSTSYVTMVSQWVVTRKLQQTFPYLAKKRCGLSNWWQVVYVWGAILGAALASIASDTMATSKGVTLPTALFGGILMLWGARFAAGCTSGHGLSGMALLAWLSFIAVPFMFVGGIITAFSMQATGALDDYVTETLGT